jgi:phenylalanyl-tRNA synthetase beta chain
MTFSVSKNEVFIDGQVALMEELFRIYGVDKIDAIPSVEQMHVNFKNEDEDLNKDLKTLMVNLGFNEIISYTLVSKETNEKFNPYKYNDPVRLDKSYVIQKNEMRFSTTSSLLEISDENRRHKKNAKSIFELTDIYRGTDKETHLGLLISGSYIKNLLFDDKKEKQNIFILRYFVDKIINTINGDIELSFESFKTKSGLVQEIKILSNKVMVGYMANNIKNDEFVLDINVSKLNNEVKEKTEYNKIGFTNINDFDYSFDIKNVKVINTLKKEISKVKYVKEIKIIDIYEEKSILLRVYCQDLNDTIPAKINKRINDQIISIFKSNSIELR